MKVDLYTKSVLTVIAVALCAIAFQNVKVIPEAQAQMRAESWFPTKADTLKIRMVVNTDCKVDVDSLDHIHIPAGSDNTLYQSISGATIICK